jgi:hypothetical protein
MHFRALLPLLLPFCTALPEPAGLLAANTNPHQLGFVLPPPQTPPYGKALPPSHADSSSFRVWGWTSWLEDARALVRGVLRSGRGRVVVEEEGLNFGRFDNDIVLRINVSSYADRLAIAELAEVQSPQTPLYSSSSFRLHFLCVGADNDRA